MNENMSTTENPVEEPTQAPTDEKIVVGGNIAISVGPIEGAKIDLPQPPAVEKAMVESSMVMSVSAQQDAEVKNSMVMSAAAGRDMANSYGLDIMVAVGHDLKIQQGGAGILKVGGEAQVDNGTVGLLIAKSGVTLNNSRVLMTTPQAIALGAAFGAVYALLRTLLRGKKKDD
jgi:hypothetical protein